MDRTSGGAPLLSLDAVVIDTETTGLDPRKARMIELAAVRLSVGKLVADDKFRQLLRPADEMIPAETTRIHGIDDAMVAESPLFARCLAALQRVSRPGRGDRAHGRLRPCHAEARMRSRRPAVDTAAHARYAAAGADRRAGTGRLYAGEARRLARVSTSPTAIPRSATRQRPRGCFWRWCPSCATTASAPLPKPNGPALPSPPYSTIRRGPAGSRPSRRRRAPTRNGP